MWIAAWIIAGVAGVLTLTTPEARLPSDDVGLRRFVVPIDDETSVSQTFTMTADGLRGVEVAAAATGDAASGILRFELTEEGSGVVRTGEFASASLLASPSYTVEFAPIDDSKDSAFHLELLSSEQDPARGVALWATKGERYDGGTLQINGRDRWADLAFRTVAPAGRSIWDRLMDMESPPPGISRTAVILAALAAYLLVSGFVLRAFSRWHA